MAVGDYTTGPRGPALNHVAVRLASEGIPVAAIARALLRSSREIASILDLAVKAGELGEVPRHDWPPGSRRERLPTIAAIRSNDVDRLIVPMRSLYGVTVQQARLLAYIAIRREVSRTDLHALTGEPGRDVTTVMKTVDVQICKIRKHIVPLVIETVWGRGYRITRATSDAILRAVREHADTLDSVTEELATFLDTPGAMERVADTSGS